jgi:hypothetical protein
MGRVAFIIGAALCAFGVLGLTLGPRTSALSTPDGARTPSVRPALTFAAPATTATAIPEVALVAEAPGHEGCATALAYLAAHAMPGTISYCPHDAQGHLAETRLMLTNGVASTHIYIAVPCLQAYQNEAANSWGHWDDLGDWIGDHPTDPYGTC